MCNYTQGLDGGKGDKKIVRETDRGHPNRNRLAYVCHAKKSSLSCRYSEAAANNVHGNGFGQSADYPLPTRSVTSKPTRFCRMGVTCRRLVKRPFDLST